jgi:hypothetical protein
MGLSLLLESPREIQARDGVGEIVEERGRPKLEGDNCPSFDLFSSDLY